MTERSPTPSPGPETARAKRILGANPDAWDAAYRADEFGRLHGLRESPRYGVIAAWLRHQVPDDGHVLDGGCGEAALFRHALRDRSGVSYTGFDLSGVALETARSVIGPEGMSRARLIRAGLGDFVPPDPAERFDAIVLTEVLSYSRESISWLPRYRPWLAPDGVMVVTLQHPRRPDSGANGPFRDMHAAMQGGDWTVLDSVTLTNPLSRNAWDLWVFR
ncbi:SAM-dependent methyltransferase [Roseospira navarrensis]|uniref:Methyltransferase domain-containing protein n=1 Tax=Roseospira navarrensis TaxID=140058 RepID=A0A7X1ZIW4_9PROT|nr:class I SAM-dependent methyltransferase [Roseospira navarrensis]MQX38055.1 methyltransferase domain-containing protein [Roseospira navarrensis]